jgi:hypothetical protein
MLLSIPLCCNRAHDREDERIRRLLHRFTSRSRESASSEDLVLAAQQAQIALEVAEIGDGGAGLVEEVEVGEFFQEK